LYIPIEWVISCLKPSNLPSDTRNASQSRTFSGRVRVRVRVRVRIRVMVMVMVRVRVRVMLKD
jgi:hypothetical protein